MPYVRVLQHGRTLRTPEGAVAFCSTLLVEGQQRTLFDTGHVGRRTGLLSAIRGIGLAPEDIDNVVLSHAHWDHAQNLDLFPSARVLIHQAELRYASAPHPNDWATPAWTGSMLETHPNLVEVLDGFVVEPGVTLAHTPGHSPGSVSALVETDEGISVLAGDVMHRASVAMTGRNPLVFWDVDAANDSIGRLVEVADVIYPGHDFPFRLVDGNIHYLERVPMPLGGLDFNDPQSFVEDTSPRGEWVMPGAGQHQVASGSRASGQGGSE